MGETWPVSWRGNLNSVAAMAVFDPLCLIPRSADLSILQLQKVYGKETSPIREHEADFRGDEENGF